jgi:type I restriction enzyme M protein
MAKNRAVLDLLSKKRLVEIAHTFGFLGWSVLSKDEIVRSLSRRKFFEKTLESLRTDELKSICLELELKAGGLKKQDYIDRITGKEIDAKPPEPKAKRPVRNNKTTRPIKAKPAAETKPSKDRGKREPKMAQNNNGIAELEKRLWAAADQLRANSSLTAQQYSRPVLGLIFLKYADQRFSEAEKQLGNQVSGRRREVGKLDYQSKGVLYLHEKARFSNLIKLPEGADIGKAINQAMDLIETENEDLRGVLPRTYNRLESPFLFELLKLFNSIPMDIEGDVFGRIYEYFLGKFAMSEGRGGGEFFTPTSIVKLIVNIIEPFNGRIYDPACGSGGMFVQSAKFVQEHRKNPTTDIMVFGQESKGDNINIGKMNLGVHGLSGDIRLGNTYYEDFHNSLGKFDYVMANPPFNVNGVDKERIKDDRRYPFGIPRTDNANYLWIQAFYSALNDKGRAGFVMANSAADAGGSELELRKKLTQTGHVDVVVAISTNFFYSVTLPVTLWFFDKRKPKERMDKVLFIDARNVYNQVDRAHRDFMPEQLEFLSNIVRLYRKEDTETQFGSDELLKEHFPKSKYQDLKGLCKVASLAEIEAQGWSLNPGRFVGVAEAGGDDGDFELRLQELNEELEVLNVESNDLQDRIARNIVELLK